jgi:hypothetical protein
MAKTSIIERIAAERKKKRRKRSRSKKSKPKKLDSDLSVDELQRMKDELEVKIQVSKQRSAKSGDEATLAAIKAELASKKTTVSTPRGDLKALKVLVDSGTQEDWLVFFGENLKSETKMEFPAIDPQKCKFSDYGYRRLIELIIESEKFLKLIIEIKDISGFQVVELNHLIRGDDPTLRGIEALCNLIINQQVNYNPVCETDFKYLNVLLDSFTIPTKEGINRVWELDINNKKFVISASFDKAAQEWSYKYSKPQPQP